MKSSVFLRFFAVSAAWAIFSSLCPAQQNVAQSLDVLDEKVSRLRAEVEDVQFRQQKMQEELTKIQGDLQELRRSAGGTVAAGDLQALEARVQALDAARQKDKQVILDTLAKELASITATRPGGKSAAATPAETREHVVQKGENLTSIAKQYSVQIEDLKKANNLSDDKIKVGQKLVIPK